MPRTRRASARSFAALALGACSAAFSVAAPLGCNLDAAVFVDPDIEAPVIEASKVALGSTVKGSFTLTLHLSVRASGESRVILGTFALKKPNEETVLVDSLPIVADPGSEVTVPEGETVTVKVSIDTGSKLLDASVRDAICGGDVVIAGIIQDSLLTTTTPVVSDPFTPACP